MKPMGAKAAALLLALAATGLAGAPESMSAQPIVTSGHRGAVLDVAEDSERRLLLSVGEDGFLRVWDKGTGILQRKIAVTRQKAASVALDPRAPLAAVLVTDGLRSFAVDVWD